jgi:hypothetical protein
MRIFRSLGYLAMAFILSTSFVGCSDDSYEKGEEVKVNYTNSTVYFQCECLGNFYRLVDLTPYVEVNGEESDKITFRYDAGVAQIIINEVYPSSTVTVYLNVKRNSTAINKNTIYNRMVTPSFIVTRNFSNGGTENGGTISYDTENVSQIAISEIDDYIQREGDRKYTIRLNDQGKLRQ